MPSGALPSSKALKCGQSTFGWQVLADISFQLPITGSSVRLSHHKQGPREGPQKVGSSSRWDLGI
jgi:hypothetical protein